MELIAFIVPTSKHTPFPTGTHNGYVAIPPKHPCYCKGYDEEPLCDIEVHGGITLSEPVVVGSQTFMSGSPIRPEYIGKRTLLLDNAEYITVGKCIPDDWWILGFDTCHLGDNEVKWNRDNVIRETLRFKEQLEKIANPINQKTSTIMTTENYINEKVVVRGTNSGVFFGTLAARDGQEVKLTNVRRLWYWSGAASDFQLAAEGVKKPGDCKFTMTIDELVILDAIEVLPCTPEAVESLSGVPVWKI